MSDNLNINSPPNKDGSSSARIGEDEVHFVDLLIVLAKYKTLIIGLPLVVAICAAGVSLLSPNIYTAATRILPPQQSASSTSALLNQLGGALGGLVGGSTGIRNPGDLYVGILKSRTIADNLIARFDLERIYEQQLKSGSRDVLEIRTSIASGKDGFILISVEDRDPARAADLANGYVDELIKLTNVLAVTEASQRRLFFERQLARARENLMRAEISARQALAKGGLVKVDDQGRAMVETTARLRAQIAVKEVQISTMRVFAADRNPELQRAQQELEALKREASKLEGAAEYKTIDSLNANGQGNGLKNLGLLRDLKYNETVYELLAKQYEAAKIDEGKDSPLLQVIDRAVVPDRKSKPKRFQIVMISALVALGISILWAFVSEYLASAAGNSDQVVRFRKLKQNLGWK